MNMFHVACSKSLASGRPLPFTALAETPQGAGSASSRFFGCNSV